MTQTDSVSRLRELIAPARQRLEAHPLYREIKTVQQLRLFMQSHVFAVWDFMSLLKWLQAKLTCVAVPWLPSPHPQACRLINEIVLGEESDAFGSAHMSHFQLYLTAMQQAGADTSAVLGLLDALRQGQSLTDAMRDASLPQEAATFLASTFSFIDQGKPHVVAAAFTFGREDLIPDMFHRMVKDLRQNMESVNLFEYYLDRHIEVDGDSHGPMALQMMEELCGVDDAKWEEAALAAQSALEARVALWDGILVRVRAAGHTCNTL